MKSTPSPQKKRKMSDNIDTKLTDLDQSFMEFKYTESRKSKSPAIVKDRHLSYYRTMCHLCLTPPSDDSDEEISCGAVMTFLNADKHDFARELAKSVLEFYNCTKLTNFKLVKVCKVNFGGLHFGLTFRAQEDGSEECPLFQGAVQCKMRVGKKPVFCEIKEDEEVTLLPDDDDYVSPKGSCDSKDSSPFLCKNDPGDGFLSNPGDGSIGGSDVSGGSLK